MDRVSSSRVETRSQCAHIVRLAALCLLALQLAACVTTSSVPNSPFLTAVVRLNPLARPPESVANANAAVIDTPKAQAAEVQSGTPRPAVATADVETTSAVPSAERRDVYPQVASASRNLATIAAPAAPGIARPGVTDAARPASNGRGILLGEAVGAAVLSHPLMGAQAAKVSGSLADVRGAEGSLKPQLQVYAGSGGSYLGSYVNYPRQFSDVAIPGSSRSDAGFTLRQLIYDFGAAKADIARSKSLVDAERLRLADQAEDIALRTANAYFNLLEQSELVALIDKVVADDNSFAKLVMLNEKQGNGTVADVNRIKSKVIEVEAVRTDVMTALRTAEDEFFRLTKLDPGQVRRSSSSLPRIPSSFEPALAAAKQSNPSLLALSANGSSIEHQLASQKAQQLPRVDLQGDGLVKHYIGNQAASQGVVDSRLMVMVSYKLFDGGIMASQVDRIREDKRANDFRALDEKESIELNLRRLYQSLSSNRIKETSAIQGIATAQKANTLYLEQFKAGKRTVFEVLDSRMVVFTMQKNAVNGKYEQLRAAYGILRNVGTLVETAVRSPAGS
ncbi:putative outer membrane efflux protein [Bradyrhizobium oligotrophicum S58]|uniref:Putative outer membrane efflux protein n=1 Tax=Bradyrhizobium oligotrophicum S58 TaxID=1245469 RepID=M4ZMI9_9BRAD|nr:putative outer membrane efflux protein [Bradyrhizobium oligotrophicum S58]